jgi:hypothetical protein
VAVLYMVFLPAYEVKCSLTHHTVSLRSDTLPPLIRGRGSIDAPLPAALGSCLFAPCLVMLLSTFLTLILTVTLTLTKPKLSGGVYVSSWPSGHLRGPT